jgi:hypothetical protein
LTPREVIEVRQRSCWIAAAGLAVSVAAAEPAPVHSAPGVTERELIAVIQALVREDAVGSRASLERLKATVRSVQSDEADTLSSDLVVHAQAFRAALARARESAGAGELMRAFDDFYWAQRSCRQCHEAARRQGIGGVPAAPAPAAPPGSP